jgi:hypothetical protein
MRAKMAMAPKDMADKTMRNTPYKRSIYTDFKTLDVDWVFFIRIL